MTQIIRIPADASVETARRLMAQSTDPQVALELPAKWAGLANVAQMRLLQRQAHIQQLDVALITRSGETHRAAAQVGIPAFYSQADLDRRPNWYVRPAKSGAPMIDPQDPAQGLPDPPAWRLPSKGEGVVNQAARPSLHRSRRRRIRAEESYRKPTPAWFPLAGYALTGLLFAIMLGLFALTVIPAATVTLTPGQQELSVDVALSANPYLDFPDATLGQTGARVVESRIEATGSLPTSGSEQVAVGKAQGIVTFSNKGRQAVRIPAGTTVRTGTGTPVSFVTLQEVEVPGQVSGRVDVLVEAVDLGAAGNVRAGTINTVGGSLDAQVAVSNASPTYSGSSQLTKVVKQIDKDTLLDQLYTQVQQDAYAALAATLEPGEWLSPDSVTTQIVADIYDAFNDEPAEVVNLDLRVSVQGVAISDADATEAARTQLQQSVPKGGKLVASSVAFSRLGEAETAGSVVNFIMRATGNYVIPIDPDEVRSAIAGKSPEEATRILQERWSLAAAPEIFRDPQWRNAMPAIPGRIQVRVAYSEAGE